MNKKELAAAIAADTDLTQAQAGDAIGAVVAAISVALSKGESVALTGFGTFSPVHRPTRIRRKPATGEEVQVAESWTAKFKPGRVLKTVIAHGGKGEAK